MKTSIALALCLLALTPAAFALEGNDGPHGAPLPHPPPFEGALLAEMTVSPGFVPNPQLTGVRIYSTGAVKRFVKVVRENQPEQEIQVATLEPAVVTKLAQEVESIRAAPLQDQDPSAPRCMDGPSTSYDVVKSGTTERTPIAAHESCHNFLLSSGQGRNIKTMLDGLNALGLL